MANRQPVKTLNKTAAAIVADAAAEKARKAASRKALRESRAAAKPAAPVRVEPTPDAIAAKHAAEREAYAAALRIDAAALGLEGEAADAYVAESLDPKPEAKHAYTGPMLILRDAAKHYTKGANGNPHCNDQMAQILDGLNREQVVTLLIKAMKLEGNPYLHLNPGQQSMNLRNKARGQIKNGLLTFTEIDAAKHTMLTDAA